MIEYKINILSKHSIVKTIWKKFLKNDNTWHFTLEGDYIELRLGKPRKDLEAYFRTKKWNFRVFPYSDNIPITRKYQRQFEKIFHEYSLLSMLIKHEVQAIDEKGDFFEEYEIIDRCIHLLFNIFGKNNQAESFYVANYVVNRAYFAGWYGAKEQEKKIKADKEG